MPRNELVIVVASSLCLLGSCGSQANTSREFQPALGRVPADWKPVSQDQIRAKLEQVTRAYAAHGPVQNSMGLATPLCRPPLVQPVMSGAEPGSPHAEKLYLLYATPPSTYLAALGQLPVGQSVDQSEPLAVVKEAYVAIPVTSQDASGTPDPRSGAKSSPHATIDSKAYAKGPLSALFIMLKCAEDTPETDRGWVYATAAPKAASDPGSGQSANPTFIITSMGKIESCMECHVDSRHDRLLSKGVVHSAAGITPGGT